MPTADLIKKITMDENSIPSILNKHNALSWTKSLDGLNDAEVKRYYNIEDKLKQIDCKNIYLIYTYLITLLIVLGIVNVFMHPDNTFIANIPVALLLSIAPPFPLFLYVIIPEWLKEKAKKRLPEYEELQKLKQKVIEYKRLQVSFWASLSGIGFEREVARVFQGLGYSVSLTKASGDGGVDIIMYKDSQRVIVQCKAHKKPIGTPTIERLYGTLMHSKADKAILVSLNGFAKGSNNYIYGKQIELLSLIDILNFESEIQNQNK